MVILDLTDQGDCNYSTLLILLYPGYSVEDMQTEKRPQKLAQNKIQQLQQNPRGSHSAQWEKLLPMGRLLTSIPIVQIPLCRFCVYSFVNLGTTSSRPWRFLPAQCSGPLLVLKKPPGVREGTKDTSLQSMCSNPLSLLSSPIVDWCDWSFFNLNIFGCCYLSLLFILL